MPGTINCEICGVKLKEIDLPDHKIAHRVEKLQAARHEVERVAEIQEYFDYERH